jgi:hypothetical protein
LGANRGDNSGITGIVSIIGSPQFYARCYFFDKAGSVQKIDRTGRGNTTDFAQTRSIREASKIVLRGKVVGDGWPEPTNLLDANGTIILQFSTDPSGATGKKVTHSVIFDGSSISFNENKEDDWDIQISATVVARPTWSGWPGTQVTPTAPVLTDQETWAGLQKTYDAQGLLTGAIRRIDVVGVADTDAAEEAKLAALVAAALVPMTNLKVVTATFERTDKNGGTVVIQWGLQNSEDQVETPRATITTDPNDLNDEETRAIVYNTGSPPSNPALPTGMKLRQYVDQKLNDQKWVRIYTWQKNDSVDDYEYPATWESIDPEHLQSSASGGTIDGTPSTPSGFTLRKSKTVTVKTGHTFTESEFGLRTTAEDIEFPGTKTEVDPFDLDTTGVETTVHDTDTPPSDPSPPTHTKIVNKWTIELTSAGTAQSQTVWNFAPQSSVDKIEQGESRITTDANALESAARVTAVDGTPSTPSGLVVRLTTTRDLSDWHTATSVEYGTRDTVDDIEMPGTVTTADPLELDSKAKAAEVYTTLSGAPASPAAPLTELQLVATETEELNRTKSVLRSIYDTLTSEEKRTFPKTSTKDDANNIDDEAMRAEFWNTGDTPPALPTDTPANNVKLLFFVDTPETAGKRLRVWFYGPKNSRDMVVQPHYESTADLSFLENTAIRAALDGESITDPAGLTLRLTKTIPLTFSLGTNRTLTIKIYGLRTTAQDISLPGTHTFIDPSGLRSEGIETQVYLTATGPAAATVPSGLQVYGSEVTEINTLTSKKEFIYRIDTAEQEVVNANTKSFRAGMLPNYNVVTTLSSSTDTPDDIADSMIDALLATTNFHTLEVDKENQNIAKIKITYVDPGQLIHEETRAENVPAYVKMNGSTPQVYVAQKFSRGTGANWLRLGEGRINVVNRIITLTRRYTGTSISGFASLRNKTNASSFLGQAAASVLYIGNDGDFNLIPVTAGPIDIKFYFRQCSNLYTEVLDWVPELYTSLDPAEGSWVDASSVGIHTSTPSTGDFSVFLGAL